MKIMGTPCKLALLAVWVLLGTLGAMAQEKLSRTPERSFAMGRDGGLHLGHRYGNVLLQGWDREKVAVRVSIKVDHKKKQSAQELLDRINPEFTATGGLLSINTEIENRKKGWLADFINSTLPLGVDRGNVQIDYEIYLPKGTDLRVGNK